MAKNWNVLHVYSNYTMGLTRHLYKEDEVVAALQYNILLGRKEAAFWCQELLDSGLAQLLIDSLRQIWLVGFGIGAISWYRAFTVFAEGDELDAAEAIRLTISLKGRDTSYLRILGSSLSADRVGLCVIPKGLKGVDAFFAAAILQGRATTAWKAFGQITSETMQRVAEVKHGQAGLDIISLFQEYPIMVIAALCLPRGELAQRLDCPQRAAIRDLPLAEWEENIDRKCRRISVPLGCLYWLTERGSTSVYTTHEKELRGSLERPGKLWGSTYWDTLVDHVGWEAIRSDDDVREEFYENFFPTDTPDEWSIADREMSHGRGVLQPNTVCSVERFLTTWFGDIPSAVVWDNSYLKNMRGVGWTLEPIHSPTDIVMEPVRRIIGITAV